MIILHARKIPTGQCKVDIFSSLKKPLLGNKKVEIHRTDKHECKDMNLAF